MERPPTDFSLEAIHERVEADRHDLDARIQEARVHEIPAIRRRIDADRPAIEARIAESILARQKRWREQEQ